MGKRALGIGLSTVMGAAMVVAGAGPAPAATVTACVKKKTGDVRIVKASKKCKKGWKKVSWNQKGSPGPQGSQGAPGQALLVKAGNGTVLGRYLGIYPAGFSVLFVEINGGTYVYAPNGQLLPLASDSPEWRTNTCTGTPYVRSSNPDNTALFVGSAGGPSRVVYRVTNPAPGPVRAWAFTTVTENVNQMLYELNNTGTCVASSNHNGTLVALQEVTAPQDVPGPLTIG